MAKVLNKYEFPEQRTRRTYDWDELLDGKIRELAPDEDYGGNPRGFMSRIRTVARERGQTVDVDLKENGGIVVQAHGTPVPQKAE